MDLRKALAIGAATDQGRVEDRQEARENDPSSKAGICRVLEDGEGTCEAIGGDHMASPSPRMGEMQTRGHRSCCRDMMMSFGRFKKVMIGDTDGDEEDDDALFYVIVKEETTEEQIMEDPDGVGVICSCFTEENADMIVSALNRMAMH